MMRVVNVKEDVLVALGIVTDFSYAWRLVLDFVPAMQVCTKIEMLNYILFKNTFDVRREFDRNRRLC